MLKYIHFKYIDNYSIFRSHHSAKQGARLGLVLKSDLPLTGKADSDGDERAIAYPLQAYKNLGA